VREPGDAVAKGAALYAALRAPQSLLNELQKRAVGTTKVADITPHYFGIALHEPNSNTARFNRVLIEKGLRTPHAVVKDFFTSEGENLTGIKLTITQSGKSERSLDNVKVVFDQHVPIDPNSKSGDPIRVTFSYDENGVMHCHLKEMKTGKVTEVKLDSF
jgi:molecular chaperone DnaK